jgi:hypothetical protein
MFHQLIRISVAFLLMNAGFAFTRTAARAEIQEAELTDEFVHVVETLSLLGDRSTGSAGAEAAAAFIRERFSELGFETVDSMQFAVPVIQYGESTLSLPGQGHAIPIRPLAGNAITPQTIAAPGITAPLVYVGAGELHHFNAKEVAGAVVLMELDSGNHWLYAANLGARGLIYVDRDVSPKIFYEDKLELSPIQFPRFWMPLSQLRDLFGFFESAPGGLVSAEINLISKTRWHSVTAENIYCFIPGTNPELEEELILVEAFYDSAFWVSGLAPGADEACSVATLLDLARSLKEHPPSRPILLVATAGHAQTLAGMRELVWSLSTRSKDLRDMKNHLKALIKDADKTIQALAEMNFDDNGKDGAQAPVSDAALMKALGERIKTEADAVSRRLMRLRMQAKDQIDQETLRKLAAERQELRRLMWQTEFDLLAEDDRRVLRQMVPKARRDQEEILADAQRQLEQLESASAFRGKVKQSDLTVAISLHLSSHGDGFGAFNYGWLYPFRPRINRLSAYSSLEEVLQQAGKRVEQSLGLTDFFKDTLRPSQHRSWQNYFFDRPPLGGEVTALAGYHGLSFVTTNDARSMWGTPWDTIDRVNFDFALKQSRMVCDLIQDLARAPQLQSDIFPRNGIADITGRAKFLRHGELFADQPAPGTVLLAYQGPARYHVMVDHMGSFYLRGMADSKHSFHKVILEGYKFDPETGDVIWVIDKKQTGKNAFRVKMQRRLMETDLIMFACKGSTLFDLLEPRTFRYLTKPKVIDARREAEPLHWFVSRLDTWASIITTVFLEDGTPYKITLSDNVLQNKLVLLQNSEENPVGLGYPIDDWPVLDRTAYRVADNMWTLLEPRVDNLEECGVYNEQIRKLQQEGVAELKNAEAAYREKKYNRFFESSFWSWALATRVYADVEKTQKDVLYGVLFYIALFVPFAFCMERLLFSFTDIYKRIIAFILILMSLIVIIYNVHPAFRLAYSPMVVILAFFIMGLSLIVTLIIFFRFEEEMVQLQSRAKLVQANELGRWKAFVAAFLLGVSNLRRRRLRTALTCITLIILTFTIMSFTSAKSVRRHARILYNSNSPYQGFLLKNVNWTGLPREALGVLTNFFEEKGVAVPRVWLEDEDKTRSTRITIQYRDRQFEAQGLVGLSDEEPRVSGLDEVLIGGRWFLPGERQAVLLSERMAGQLGIDPGRPQSEVVLLYGMPFDVVGVFAGGQFQERLDLDGEPLTPVIFPRETSTALSDVESEALESGEDVREFQSRYEHIAGDLTLIIPYQTLLAAGGHLKAVAVRLDSQTSIQSIAGTLVDRFGLSLFSGEPEGTYLYHASDSMSYSGVPNIIIPLIISVFIVLNTMIGSVYERKREIGIYTSVGLAPSHVSFLFIAEAMAFAVLSAVFGYLLAQTTAKLFAETALWSGITVNYSSLAGVAAMILVMAVVLISVIYPSKVAGEIAIPDVNRSWTLPEAKGNEMEITLPFLMTYREHRSVGGYLFDYFMGHQDVSHGMFSTANIEFGFTCHTPPSITRNDNDCPEDDCPEVVCLEIRSMVWLAPFDFGIMQSADLVFRPAEDDAGFLEVHVRLIRQSGEANAWRRINKAFLHNVRKQLLMWRSFDDDTKVYYEQIIADAEQKLQRSGN